VLRPPTQIAIPRLGISADTVDLGVEPDGTLEAPATGGVIGWYRQSGRPGQIGNMIVSGHVDWDKQPAVFWRLGELQAGDRVEVFAQGGARYRYEVEWSKSVDPASAPLGEILGPTSERWLTLITCGGPFDARTRSYRERAIVRAKLVTSG
jgi:LPXTG-site transpeptidase (sortase) family protein